MRRPARLPPARRLTKRRPLPALADPTTPRTRFWTAVRSLLSFVGIARTTVVETTESRTKSRRRPLQLRRLVLLFAALCVAPPVALATNFGSSASGYRLAEDSYPGVAKLNLSYAASDGVNHTVINVYNPTDLLGAILNNQTNCADSLGHDVCVLDANYGTTGWYGITECIGTSFGSHPNMRCTRSRVRLNLTYYSFWQNFPRHLVCHEMGHSVGLQHRGSGSTCLYTPAFGPFPNYWDAHDNAHVNAHY